MNTRLMYWSVFHLSLIHIFSRTVAMVLKYFDGTLPTEREAGPEAVSYTHLDVYKRQGRSSMARMSVSAQSDLVWLGRP